MISPFGVDHGEEISKLGSPQVHGRSYSIIERDGGTTTTHGPTHVDVKDTGKKTMFLRRPKYRFEAHPDASKIKTKETGQYYLTRSGKERPDKNTRDQIVSHVKSGSKKTAKINGMNVKVQKSQGNETLDDWIGHREVEAPKIAPRYVRNEKGQFLSNTPAAPFGVPHDITPKD